MKCGFPALRDHPTIPGEQISYPCGRCMPCRISNRQHKAARFLLEARGQEIRNRGNSFLTLTVDEKHVDVIIGRDGVPVENLNAETFCKALKRARFHHYEPFRFAAVGEYGDRTHRPHYHVLAFGISPGDALAAFTKAWTDDDDLPIGFVDSKEFIPARADYLAGYTIKRMTHSDDERLHPNQQPEFYRVSRNPGIGALPETLDYLEQLHQTAGGAQVIATTHDVNPFFRLSGKIWPLDSFMKNKLRQRLGLPPSDSRRESDALMPQPMEMQMDHERRHEQMLRRHKKTIRKRIM